MSMVWTIALLVVSNIIYQLCANVVSKDIDAMESMTITYFAGVVCSVICNKIGTVQ